MVSLRPDVYDKLQDLADRRSRPLSWELRRIVIKELKAAGLWSEADDLAEPEEDEE